MAGTTPETVGTADDALPRLQGERVVLRGFRADDLQGLYALHSDPQVMRYWSFPAWTDIGQADQYFANARAGRDPERMLCWATTLAGDDQLIGTATLYAIDRVQGRAEIGYALGAGHWGKGYAREAVSLALDHAFDTLGLRRIEADIDPRNSGSCALVERLGFSREGLLRERWHVNDELCDSALYGLLASDWHSRRQPPM